MWCLMNRIIKKSTLGCLVLTWSASKQTMVLACITIRMRTFIETALMVSFDWLRGPVTRRYCTGSGSKNEMLLKEGRVEGWVAPKNYNSSWPGGVSSKCCGKPWRWGGREEDTVGVLSKYRNSDSVNRSNMDLSPTSKLCATVKNVLKNRCQKSKNVAQINEPFLEKCKK